MYGNVAQLGPHYRTMRIKSKILKAGLVLAFFDENLI